MTIDSSSIISNKTKIHPSVNIGPFCIIGDDVEIEVSSTDDNRSYHISSNKIFDELGFKPEFTVEDAVMDLKDAFENNLLPNSLDDEKYFNIKRMNSIKLI